MAGYLLIEERMLQPHKPDGFSPHPHYFGLLDFLRELRQEVFPFPAGHKIRIVGTEDVLLAAGDNLIDVQAYIHSIMAPKANELESHLGTSIQVVFRSPLRKGDDFWVEAGMEKHLSLRRLFDSPRLQEDRSRNEYYFVGFNLT